MLLHSKIKKICTTQISDNQVVVSGYDAVDLKRKSNQTKIKNWIAKPVHFDHHVEQACMIYIEPLKYPPFRFKTMKMKHTCLKSEHRQSPLLVVFKTHLRPVLPALFALLCVLFFAKLYLPLPQCLYTTGPCGRENKAVDKCIAWQTLSGIRNPDQAHFSIFVTFHFFQIRNAF